MSKKSALPITVIVLVLVLLFSGCTSSVPTGTSSETTGQATAIQTSPSAGTPTGGSLIIKNNGSQDIHAWITTDQSAWGGNGNNRINPAASLTLQYESAPGGAQQYLCIGRSEKVAKCTEIMSTITTLVWDGTALSANP